MNSTAESRLDNLPLSDSSKSNLSASNLSESHTRLHYMDNLRAIAMLMGVFFHAALAYSPILHNVWLSADSQQSAIVDVIAWFTHLFRMPLFFVIAGFFVAYLVKKRGMTNMLKNRALRIFLPLVIFFPLCLWAVIGSLTHALVHVQNKSPILLMIINAAPGTPPPTTMHLWFLYNLIFFCVFTWILSNFSWVWLRTYVSTIKPTVFLMTFPLLLVPALWSVSAPMPAPDNFLPQLWSFGFFGIFFALGYLLFGLENFIERFKAYGFILLLMSVVVYAVYYYLIPKQSSFVPVPLALWEKLTLTLCEVYISVWMTVACLVFGKRYLHSHSRIMRFISDSSYWIYLIHLPILFAVQYQLMDKNWSLLAKYGASLSFTLIVGVLSYLLLVRWTPIGWLLNGRKLKPN